AYHSLAVCQQAQGGYDRAEHLLTQAAAGFRSARLRVASAGLQRAAFTSQHSPLARLAAVLARNGKPESAWQRFEEGLGRSTRDEFAARRKRRPHERQPQTQPRARLDHLDRRLQAVPLSPSTPEPEKQRQELLAHKRQALDALHALMQQLEHKYGVGEGQLFPLAQVQARLPADVALI